MLTEEEKERIQSTYIKKKGWSFGRALAKKAIRFIEIYESSDTIEEVRNRSGIRNPNNQIVRIERYTGMKFKRFPMGGYRVSNNFKKIVDTQLGARGLEMDWENLKIKKHV